MSRTRQRIYWREQGGAKRAYADFRDLGGKREALRLPGAKRATTDAEVAEALYSKRVGALLRQRAVSGVREANDLPRVTTVARWVREHLLAKAKAGKVTDQWMEGEELRLQRAVNHFGADRDLSSVTVADVRQWAEALARQGLAGGTVRQHLNSVSNLYRRAQAEQKVVPGYNPAAAMMDKPTYDPAPAHWLEVPEAALLLEAARTFKPKRADAAMPFAYQLIATALLTGGRPAEVLGLEVGDVNLEGDKVTFRPNAWRRLKTLTSYRTVPLWPQLKEILKPLIARRTVAKGRLLFPSYRTGKETMLTDCRKMLDAVGGRVGYKPRELNLYDFRHTYCAARLQTLDGDAPVSPYTVGQELGHGGDALVKRVYGHLGSVRHRANAVEYRVNDYPKAQHRDKPVREWLKVLRAA